MANQIMVIRPYRQHGTWVFDDPARELVQEPFVHGVPEIIDTMVEDIEDAKAGFRLLFSAEPVDAEDKVAVRHAAGELS